MSGLQLKISAIEQKDSFVVYDCTGNYKYDNLGGWGNPNARIKLITKAILYVTTPKTPIGSEPAEIDVTDDFPNENFLGLEILPYQVGLQKIVSGKYKIKLEVTGVDSKGVTYVKHSTAIVVFSKDVKCCVDKLERIVNENAFKDEKQKKVIELNNLIESLDYNIDKELFDQAVSIIDYVSEQCICPGC